MQELCLGGTLAELMSSGALATEHGGVHIHRMITILQHVASGLAHLHRLSLTFGDLDPSQVPSSLLSLF
jgi:serine/threonine protein kinase